jgi:hypothetical protein
LIVISPSILVVKVIEYFSNKREVAQFEKIEKKREQLKKTEVDLDKYYEEEFQKLERRNRLLERAGYAFFIAIISAVVIFAIGACINAVMKYGWLHVLITIGVVVGISLTCLGIIFLIVQFFPKLINWIGERSIVKMIKGMIVAYYEKACPLIKWEGANDDSELQNAKI